MQKMLCKYIKLSDQCKDCMNEDKYYITKHKINELK